MQKKKGKRTGGGWQRSCGNDQQLGENQRHEKTWKRKKRRRLQKPIVKAETTNAGEGAYPKGTRDEIPHGVIGFPE